MSGKKKQARPVGRARTLRPKGGAGKKRGSASTSAMRSARIRVSTAPAAVSMSVGMSLNFSSAKGGRHLVAGACLPICQIGTDLFTNGLVLTTGAGTSAPAGFAFLNPQFLPGYQKDAADPPTGVNGRWLAPQVSLISQAFDKYHVRAMEFIYEPQSTTATADRLVFAYSEDPRHPILGGAAATTVPSQTDLLITPDSVAFAPWTPWTLRVPVENTDEYYIAPQDQNQRLSYHGLIACRSTTVAAAVTYGVLYCRLLYEFVDPVPVVNTVVPSSLGNFPREGKITIRTGEQKESTAPLARTDGPVRRHSDDDWQASTPTAVAASPAAPVRVSSRK